MSTPQILVRLFRNECDRIFCDRLTTSEDQKVYYGELDAIIKSTYPDCPEALKLPSLFGDFECAVERITSGAEDPRLYKDLGGYDDIRKIFDTVLEQYNQRRHSSTGFAPNELAIPEGGLESSSDAKERRKANNLAFAFMRYAAGKLKLPPKLPDEPKSKRKLLRPFLEEEIARRQKEREERRETVHERVSGEKGVKPLAKIVGELEDPFLKEGDTVRRAMKLGTYHHKSENPQWFEEKVKVSEKQGGKNKDEATDGSPLFVLQDFKDPAKPEPAETRKHKLLHIHSDLLKIKETQVRPKTEQIIDADEFVNPRWQAYRDQTDTLAREVLKLVPLTDKGIPRADMNILNLTLPLPKRLP
ncbi:hypothetical protein EBZ37_14760, partial [bacterium]|nr:hypothetical protein [bacterium]